MSEQKDLGNVVRTELKGEKINLEDWGPGVKVTAEVTYLKGNTVTVVKEDRGFIPQERTNVFLKSTTGDRYTISNGDDLTKLP
jgi:hypothetical protein